MEPPRRAAPLAAGSNRPALRLAGPRRQSLRGLDLSSRRTADSGLSFHPTPSHGGRSGATAKPQDGSPQANSSGRSAAQSALTRPPAEGPCPPIFPLWVRAHDECAPPRQMGQELSSEIAAFTFRTRRGYLRMFTARAATINASRRLAADSSSISIFAQRLSGIASVGLKAVAFVYET